MITWSGACRQVTDLFTGVSQLSETLVSVRGCVCLSGVYLVFTAYLCSREDQTSLTDTPFLWYEDNGRTHARTHRH